MIIRPAILTGCSLLICVSLGAQAPKAPVPAKGQPRAKATPQVAAQAPPPPGYVIGADDHLGVVFWSEPRMSADVVVRPDGRISLPLLNDIEAAGLTPDQLRERLAKEAARYVEDTTVTVVVRQINSRRVFITGNVVRPGPYALTGAMTVLQLVAMSGGLTEYADEKNISIMRVENGKPVTYGFNYKEVRNRKNLTQNIELRPGDTIIVP
ncbi:MAG: polysaccharide biosynthesis/export family protein [Acidobacteria bacterium]|nr:polysaccharide biosynthesis/export family protein [Acidobacteriota bacterium]